MTTVRRFMQVRVADARAFIHAVTSDTTASLLVAIIVADVAVAIALLLS